MDPNAALAEVRSLLTPPRTLGQHEALRLADLVDGLDDWLSNGGFLPADWQAKR